MLDKSESQALHLGPTPNHDRAHPATISVQDVSFWYGPKKALKDVSLEIFKKEVTAFIGPSGCGKTTLLRCLNRTNEIIPNTRIEGRILLEGQDIYAPEVDPPVLRRRFGWIAQKPNPFPRSISRNITYGAELQGLATNRADRTALVEKSLQAVGMWDEVKDRLRQPGTDLSGGQQQRLCIARAIAMQPDVVLMDEPCSALDPVSTALVEELIDELRQNYTIVIVTHNMQQAARVAQRVAFFRLGELIEAGDSKDIFVRPQTDRCHDFITGRYG